MKEFNDPGNSHLGDIWCVIKMSNLNALKEENWSENHVNWSENCGIDIYDKANLLSSVLTEGDFYEGARKWSCQLNPTSITKTSLKKKRLSWGTSFISNWKELLILLKLAEPSLLEGLTRSHQFAQLCWTEVNKQHQPKIQFKYVPDPTN